MTPVEFQRFTPLKVFGDDRVALGLVEFEATVRATGKRIVEVGEVHIWHFDDQGRVARFRHAADTWQHAAALRSD